MAALEAATLSIFSFSSSSFSKSHLYPKPPHSSVKLLHISNSTLSLSHNFPLFPFANPTRKSCCFQLCSAVEEATVVEEKPEETQKQNLRKKLYVFNLPWSFSVVDIKNLFGQCGAVTDVEIIKHKDGKSRNFAFVTMASGEEAQAAVDKLDTLEVSGRIIRVEFAKKFKKPHPPREPQPQSPLAGETQNGETQSVETQHKLYVSNLAWKVRSTSLREFFSADHNPVSAKVVFEAPGRSGGYGFVSFATKEEAEAAISSLNGKVNLTTQMDKNGVAMECVMTRMECQGNVLD
ncbi:hypothetical protein Pint_03449 [Pistacia integerrima]|uniref:Uncharacterized protein n=1 Tax=Pistacia integerrima TaxID=434235 RepID=A0ACC0ZIL8_9ROSI|nr:hypothetical protein Pint_03449 [Pistacia integerrima]